MPDFDRKTLGSISSEDLLALELDEALPIDDWMAVEKERGRREERRRREAERARRHPPAGTGPATRRRGEALRGLRIQDALAQLRALLVPGETIGAYAVQRRLFALTHRRISSAPRAAASSRSSAASSAATCRTTCAGRISTTRASARASSARAHHHLARQRRSRVARQRRPHRPDRRPAQGSGAAGLHALPGAGAGVAREAPRPRPRRAARPVGRRDIGGRSPARRPVSPRAGGDPTERLRKAKQMLDDGLITDTEYESIKARVVDGL